MGRNAGARVAAGQVSRGMYPRYGVVHDDGVPGQKVRGWGNTGKYVREAVALGAPSLPGPARYEARISIARSKGCGIIIKSRSRGRGRALGAGLERVACDCSMFMGVARLVSRAAGGWMLRRQSGGVFRNVEGFVMHGYTLGTTMRFDYGLGIPDP